MDTRERTSNINCRGCGKFLMDAQQAAELRSEIGMSLGTTIEGRMSDMNDIDVCSRCLAIEVEAQEAQGGE